MHKAQWPTLLEDPGAGELVGRGRGGARGHAGKAGREPKVGLAEHGRRACQLVGSGGEAPQAQHDRLRDRARGKGFDARRGRRGRLYGLLGNRADQLLDEERNAARRRMARPRERRIHLGPEPQLYQLGHRPLAQRCQRKNLRRPVGGERRKQRRNVRRLGRPCRGDYRDRQLGKPRSEIVEEPQRGLVSPMGIIDTEQQRGASAEVRAQPVEPVQDRERRVQQRIGDVILRHRDAQQTGRAPGRAAEELRPFRR